jgi:hypothetical protein
LPLSYSGSPGRDNYARNYSRRLEFGFDLHAGGSDFHRLQRSRCYVKEPIGSNSIVRSDVYSSTSEGRVPQPVRSYGVIDLGGESPLFRGEFTSVSGLKPICHMAGQNGHFYAVHALFGAVAPAVLVVPDVLVVSSCLSWFNCAVERL